MQHPLEGEKGKRGGRPLFILLTKKATTIFDGFGKDTRGKKEEESFLRMCGIGGRRKGYSH